MFSEGKQVTIDIYKYIFIYTIAAKWHFLFPNDPKWHWHLMTLSFLQLLLLLFLVSLYSCSKVQIEKSIEIIIYQPLTLLLPKKVGVKACILPENVVSLHRQSKEQPFVPCSGLLLRPTRVINDGRRRSSMKTPKTAGTGRSGELQTKDSKHTTDYD